MKSKIKKSRRELRSAFKIIFRIKPYPSNQMMLKLIAYDVAKFAVNEFVKKHYPTPPEVLEKLKPFQLEM